MASFWDSIKDSAKIFDSWSISKKKSINEMGVVQSLLENLGFDQRSLKSTDDNNDPPDCVFTVGSELIGIEVVALIDGDARGMSARSRLDGGPEYYADWNKESFRFAIERIVTGKAAKILGGKRSGKAAANCNNFWLVICTSEMTLTSPYVSQYVEGWKLNCPDFERVYLVLDYESGRSDNGYPYFQLQ